MRTEKELSSIAMMMFALNLSLVLFFSLICTVTTFRLCSSFGAYDFLASVRRIPPNPWRMPIASICLFGLLFLVSFFKDHYPIERFGPRLVVCVAEIALCVGVIASLNFYYSGIALLVLADLVHYVRGSRVRFCFILVLILLFAFCRYEILARPSGQIGFDAYLSFYDQTAQSWFTGMESVMQCLNILLFVLFMILLFTGQKEENVRIQKLNDQLNRANDQLRDYAMNMERMAEIRERNRLAREIHDTLGHTLTGIIAGADAGLMLFETAPAESKRRIEVVAQAARDGLNDVRRSIKALRPDELERSSLAEALESLIARFRASTSAEIDYRQDAGPLEFAPDEEDTLYRVVQESMTNAVRHGQADKLLIQFSRKGDVIIVNIRDNGSGCGELEEGFGLRHMRERLDLLGGSMICGNLDETTADGYTGFFITVHLPIRTERGSKS